MKNMKSKLLASVAMLLVSAIMLTSASFAWFTISTAPEISNITTSVTSNGNLEIALDDGDANAPADSDVGDSGHNEKWGNLVDLNAYFKTANIVLKPVDVAEETEDEANAGDVSIPEWGLDGRIKELKAATDKRITTEDLGGIHVYADGTEESAVIYAVRVDFWLRSNVEGKVSLLAPTATDKDRGAGEDGLGSYLKGDGMTDETTDKIKVAFQVGTGDLIVAARDKTSGALSAEICKLSANVAQKVSMYLYMDGADMTNADFQNLETNPGLELNIQFAHEETLYPMEVTARENGRATATTGGDAEGDTPAG